MSGADAVITRLLNADCGHTISRDKAGNSHVTIHHFGDGARDFTIVAPSFDEAVARALDIFEASERPHTPTAPSAGEKTDADT